VTEGEKKGGMLALTRRVGEKLIMMDGVVTVKVLKIDGDRVVLGLQAPREIAIHRQEAYEQRKKESKG